MDAKFPHCLQNTRKEHPSPLLYSQSLASHSNRSAWSSGSTPRWFSFEMPPLTTSLVFHFFKLKNQGMFFMSCLMSDLCHHMLQVSHRLSGSIWRQHKKNRDLFFDQTSSGIPARALPPGIVVDAPASGAWMPLLSPHAHCSTVGFFFYIS